MKRRLLAIGYTALVLSGQLRASSGRILYVDANATGPLHTGENWCQAYVSLQDALVSADSGDEIHVADGIYRPDDGVRYSAGNRNATFELSDGVALLGGFAGCGAKDPGDRDLRLFYTVLSGDLNGDDLPGFQNTDDNSYHVAFCNNVSAQTIVDGVTISGGNADGPDPELRGGGVYIVGGSPTFRNCVFRANAATLGGAVNCEGGTPRFEDSSFEGNTAGFSGAGYRGWQSSPAFINCLFHHNVAESGAGAWLGASTPLFRNCTLVDNWAFEGNSLSFASCCPQQPSVLTAVNCVFWSGGEEIFSDDGSTLSVSYSTSPTFLAGDGNINDDPLFVPGPIGNYYLSQVAAGENPSSPCVNAGFGLAELVELNLKTTRSDEEGDAGTVDMGYHYAVVGRSRLFGDSDSNGLIDLVDGAAIQRCFTGVGPVNVPAACRVFDAALNQSVDFDDMHSFSLALTGP